MNTSSLQIAWEILRRKVLPTAAIRDIDRLAIEEFSMNSLVLMENAASNCVSWIRQRYPSHTKTVVLCGSGNNGGDGIVITRHLRAYGWNCDCFVLGSFEKLSADARANAKILARPGSGLQLVDSTGFAAAFQPIAGAELIIDAMLGTGAAGNPRTPMSFWIEAANQAPADKVAIDIPTGINADTGEIGTPYFHADATLTFVALKPAMVSSTTAALFGDIEVLPIGIPEQLINALVSE
jgi:NAD(P)H-hydrate epimerase